MEETHISSLKDKIDLIRLDISAKRKHIDLLKAGIKRESKVLKLYEDGLKELESKYTVPNNNESLIHKKD